MFPTFSNVSIWVRGLVSATFRFKLDAQQFIKNITPITTISVCGTLLFIFLFSFLLSNLCALLGLRPLTFWNTLAFAAAMSASDSTYLAGFLESMGCHRRILSILEGDTILSEVISILVFRTVVELQVNEMDGVLVIEGLNYFLSYLVNSFLIGIVTGVAASMLFKWIIPSGEDVRVIEVILFFLIPIISFMIAEEMHVSSSISIRICGFIMSCYTQYNLNNETYPCVSESLSE